MPISAEATGERLQLEKAEDDEDEGDDREGDDALQASPMPRSARGIPRHVELLGKQLGGIEAALLQEVGEMRVKTLQPCSIRENPLSDPAETPDDQPATDADREERRSGGQQHRDRLRQPRLQPTLQRPDKRYDEQREGHRRHDAAGERQGGESEDDGANHRREAKHAVPNRPWRVVGLHDALRSGRFRGNAASASAGTVRIRSGQLKTNRARNRARSRRRVR